MYRKYDLKTSAQIHNSESSVIANIVDGYDLELLWF